MSQNSKNGTTYKNKINWLKISIFTISIFFAFFLIDYSEKHPFSFFVPFENTSVIWQNIDKLHKTPSIFLAFCFFVTIRFYYQFDYVKQIYREFIIPIILVAFTLFTGTYGFIQVGFNFGDAFFSAANFITLNSSVFKDNISPRKVNFWIENARFTGAVFLITAFIWALFKAVGKENSSRIGFWWYRSRFWVKNKNFDVVIGDGLEAAYLVLDITSKGKKVVFLNQGFNENIENMLSETNLWYMQGNASSQTGLKKTYFTIASQVYVIHESDEENFRTILEMHEIEKRLSSQKGEWIVHIHEANQKLLLANLLKGRFLKIFDINQLAARQVLKDHPFYHFIKTINTAQIIFVGFNDISKAILLHSFQLGHFLKGQKIKVIVYFMPQEAQFVENFKNKHQELFWNVGIFGDNDSTKKIQKATFFKEHIEEENQPEAILEFKPLPIENTGLINPSFDLYDLPKLNTFTTLFVCLKDGLENTSFLNKIMPRLGLLSKQKAFDLQVLFQYNFPDKDEESSVVERLKALFNIEINSFGNLQSICCEDTILGQNMDLRAKQINKLFAQIYIDKIDEKVAYENWNETNSNDFWTSPKYVSNETKRMSNVYAADHIDVKLALMNKIKPSFDNPTDFWTDIEIKTLAELEHRRWCAEKLLTGWLPFDEKEYKKITGKELVGEKPQEKAENLRNWWNEKIDGIKNKEKIETQMLHLDLMPFEELDPQSKEKDLSQVRGIPYFIK